MERSRFEGEGMGMKLSLESAHLGLAIQSCGWVASETHRQLVAVDLK